MLRPVVGPDALPRHLVGPYEKKEKDKRVLMVCEDRLKSAKRTLVVKAASHVCVPGCRHERGEQPLVTQTGEHVLISRSFR